MHAEAIEGTTSNADTVAARALAAGIDQAKQRSVTEAVTHQITVVFGHEKVSAVEGLPAGLGRLADMERAMPNIADAQHRRCGVRRP